MSGHDYYQKAPSQHPVVLARGRHAISKVVVTVVLCVAEVLFLAFAFGHKQESNGPYGDSASPIFVFIKVSSCFLPIVSLLGVWLDLPGLWAVCAGPVFVFCSLFPRAGVDVNGWEMAALAGLFLCATAPAVAATGPAAPAAVRRQSGLFDRLKNEFFVTCLVFQGLAWLGFILLMEGRSHMPVQWDGLGCQFGLPVASVVPTLLWLLVATLIAKFRPSPDSAVCSLAVVAASIGVFQDWQSYFSYQHNLDCQYPALGKAGMWLVQIGRLVVSLLLSLVPARAKVSEDAESDLPDL